jgi:hypothetical protein
MGYRSFHQLVYGFCVWKLCGWFLPQILPGVSYWQAYGIILLVGLLRDDSGTQHDERNRWAIAFEVLDACVPENRIAEVRAKIADQVDEFWASAGIAAFTRILGNTITLGFGWIVASLIN